MKHKKAVEYLKRKSFKANYIADVQDDMTDEFYNKKGGIWIIKLNDALKALSKGE